MCTWKDAQAVSMLFSIPFISRHPKLGEKYLAKRRAKLPLCKLIYVLNIVNVASLSQIKQPDGTWFTAYVFRPEIVNFFSTFMGGVDLL